MAVLNQQGDEKRGLPSTVIHLLPVEVLLFVDMLPYYLINRQDGKHTFWTSLAAILNLKYWIEDALEEKNVKLLTFVLNCLQRGSLKEVLADVATFPDQKHVNLDVQSLRHKKFSVNHAKVDVDNFSMVICNLIFRLRYKLVDWEGRDNFSSHAKVLPREPPKPVFCVAKNAFVATYANSELEEILAEDLTEIIEEDSSEDDIFESSQNETASKVVEEKKKDQKRKALEIETKKTEDINPSATKKGKLSEEEWKEVMEATEVLHQDDKDMCQKSEQDCLQGGQSLPPIQEGQDEQHASTFETVRPFELTNNVEEISVSEGKANQPYVCLHFHFGQSNHTSIISYESNEKSFKMTLESRPVQN